MMGPGNKVYHSIAQYNNTSTRLLITPSDDPGSILPHPVLCHNLVVGYYDGKQFDLIIPHHSYYDTLERKILESLKNIVTFSIQEDNCCVCRFFVLMCDTSNLIVFGCTTIQPSFVQLCFHVIPFVCH